MLDFEFVGRAHRDGTRARDASFEMDTHLCEDIDGRRDVIERAVERGDFHAREETRDRLASRRAAERGSTSSGVLAASRDGSAKRRRKEE